VPFLFSALAINAVSRTAGVVVQEVRRQFADGKIMRGEKQPEHGPVIDICTEASLRELTTPALLAVLTPVVIGFGIGFKALGAFLAAVILVGQLMANYLSNAGGSWDNAKKYIEDGNYGGKGSDSYRAAVIADTVGDPFKDTAGPALNPLIKVMNLVSLLILPAILSDKLVDVSTAEGVGGFGHVLNADPTGLARAIAGVALVILIGAVAFSKRKKEEFGGGSDLGASAAVGDAVEEELVSVATPAASTAPARKTAARKAPATRAPAKAVAKKAVATKKATPVKKATKKRA
jgi:K(+)-stimulated pyrophosphate-energized sodium pump